MKNNKTNYEVLFDNFEYKGHKSHYFYEIPFDTFINAVRAWFDQQMITLDGKDNDIWNALVSTDLFDTIEYEMKDWFLEHCKEDAFEEYKEKVEDDIELEQEEQDMLKDLDAEYDSVD